MEIDLNKLLIGLAIGVVLDKSNVNLSDLLSAVDIGVKPSNFPFQTPLSKTTFPAFPASLSKPTSDIGKFECETCGLVLEFNPVKETEQVINRLAGHRSVQRRCPVCNERKTFKESD